MIRDGIAPISFERPPAHHGCPGSLRLSKPQLFGVCHLCARLGNDGPQLTPAARMTGGLAQCLNFAEFGPDHKSESAPTCQVLQPPSVRGRTNPTGGGA